FPESHSVSFAYLVYASSYLKHYYPAAFLAALLNAQPMGFWAPRTLVMDARRHGVKVLGPDVNASSDKATLETFEGEVAVRVGIGYVRTIGEDLAEKIAAGRPYVDMEDLSRRCDLKVPQMEVLATAGAFDLETATPNRTVKVGGVVTHRQKPATAGGTIFVSLEDETGLINVICQKQVWARYKKVATTSKALLVTGRLERYDGVVNLLAAKIEPLSLTMASELKARDFR
ncbi:MAG TPA: OB-fold nucleic acid binding domain-containing protein, partial [Actinomycetota bacterium]|nr:OB-fold nucleic acid binding domain-containing protein [Actinomycetota bacterium]